MKKSLLLLSSFLIVSFFAFAQPSIGGPDNFGYTFKSSQDPTGPTYQWFDISQIGTLVSGLADDNFVGPFPISNFPYYTSNPTQLWVGSNGYISFMPGNIASVGASFTAIPNPTGTNNFVAPMLSDLNFAGASTNPAIAFYYNRGDTVCISFEKVPFWVNNANQYGGLNTFQVIFNKADSSITFNYRDQVGLPDPVYVNNFVSIGIENANGLDGLQYWRGNTFPPDSFSVKFYYPAVAQSITDLKVAWANDEKNGAKFLLENTPFSPIANVSNIGNQNITSNINVGFEILDTANTLLVSGNKQLSLLNSGDDSTINFTQSWSPLQNGSYTLKTYISTVSGDVARNNDTIRTLLKVVDTSKFPVILDYTDQIPFAGGISWSGGNAGVGVYIEPPFYPARIVAANYFIPTFGQVTTGFHSILYDDNARGGGPGTVLDSTYFPMAQVFRGSYNRDTLRNNIVINSGGVYLHWLMGNGDITLGRTFRQFMPMSNQTFEVIGGAWAPYRDKETQDFMMNIEIQPLSVSVNDLGLEKVKPKVYPNPSSNYIEVEWNDANRFNEQIFIFDLQGKQVDAKLMRFDNKIRVFKGSLPSGQYFIRTAQFSVPVQFID